MFTDLFDYLPIGAIIDNKVFCMHVGLSRTIHHIDDIKAIYRFQEIPHEGPFADLMWSDWSYRALSFLLFFCAVSKKLRTTCLANVRSS